MLRPAHRRQTVLGPRVFIAAAASTLGFRVRRFIARETMQRARNKRRTAICPPFSFCFPPLDSSLVLLLWNFGVEPSFGEHFGFGCIWRRSLRICWSAAFDLGEGGGNASLLLWFFRRGRPNCWLVYTFFPLRSGSIYRQPKISSRLLHTNASRI